MAKPTMRVAAAATWLLAMAVTSHAGANCVAYWQWYAANVQGNTVTIWPDCNCPRSCPDSAGMLRENVDTGELVQLADYCTSQPSELFLSNGYIDECVPAGSYRYGFVQPYECNPDACANDYFVTAEVTTALDSGCQRSAGNAAPTAASTKPWETSHDICTGDHDSGESADDSGCSMAAPRGARAVFVLDFAAVLVGLGLRRRHQSRRRK